MSLFEVRICTHRSARSRRQGDAAGFVGMVSLRSRVGARLNSMWALLSRQAEAVTHVQIRIAPALLQYGIDSLR